MTKCSDSGGILQMKNKRKKNWEKIRNLSNAGLSCLFCFLAKHCMWYVQYYVAQQILTYSYIICTFVVLYF